jgi:hypothetical protein
MRVDMSKVSESSPDEDGGAREAAVEKVRVPDHVVYRSFPGETVALNLNTGRYHGLNPVAGRMIEALAATGAIERAATVLAAEYGQPQERIAADLRRLCDDLAERGLIEMSASSDA